MKSLGFIRVISGHYLLLNSGDLGCEGMGRQVQGPVYLQETGFRGGGLTDDQAFALIVGLGLGKPHLGGQAGADGLPAVGQPSGPEAALDGGREVVRRSCPLAASSLPDLGRTLDSPGLPRRRPVQEPANPSHERQRVVVGPRLRGARVGVRGQGRRRLSFIGPGRALYGLFPIIVLPDLRPPASPHSASRASTSCTKASNLSSISAGANLMSLSRRV